MSIVVHPEYEKLKEKLTKLIFTYDELECQICPIIEREYVKRFGLLEFELYKKDVELSKIKRKHRLIQIKINNGEKIDINEITLKVEEEFSAYKENIARQREELGFVLNSKPLYLSKSDTLKLKRIYKKCVFALHPDINGNLSPDRLDLFTKINDAFKKCDLKALESLYLSIPDYEMENASDLDKLNELIDFWENKIAELKNSYPYNKKEFIEDAGKSLSYTAELEELLEEFENEIRDYEEKIISMM